MLTHTQNHTQARTQTHAPQLAHAPTLPAAIEADDSAITAALQRPASITWHALLIAVPDDWRATGKRSAPPGSTPVLSAKAACALAVLQNSERMRHGNGHVKAWTVRLRAPDGSRAMTVLIPGLWTPRSPFELPPAAVQIISPDRQHMKDTIEKLNGACDPGRRFVVVERLDHVTEAVDELSGLLDSHAGRDSAPLADPSPLAELPPADPATSAPATALNLQTWLQTPGEKPAWQAAEQPGNAETDVGPSGEPVQVAFTAKPSGYRIGLRHPEHGVVALSQKVFSPREREDILEQSAGCVVAVY